MTAYLSILSSAGPIQYNVPQLNDLANELFDATQKRNLSEVERIVEQIKSDPFLTDKMLNFEPYLYELFSAPFEVSMTPAFSSFDEVENTFKIANLYIEAYMDHAIHFLTPKFITTLASLELQLGHAAIQFDEAKYALFQAFVKKVVSAHVTLLTDSSPEAKTQRLSQYLCSAVRWGAPELARALLDEGADHTITFQGSSLSQIAGQLTSFPHTRFAQPYNDLGDLLSQIELKRDNTMREFVEAQFARLALVFSWKIRGDEAAEDLQIGHLPRDVIRLVCHHISWDPINWPLYQAPIGRIRDAVEHQWAQKESAKRKSESSSSVEEELLALSPPQKAARNSENKE